MRNVKSSGDKLKMNTRVNDPNELEEGKEKMK